MLGIKRGHRIFFTWNFEDRLSCMETITGQAVFLYYSAPHGAGRLMPRSKAKNTLSMDEYKAMMEGVYTTSVNVIDIMKPIYNFKASD